MTIAETFGMDVAAVRLYCRVSATAITDDDLSRMMDTAGADVIARCRWPGMDDEVLPAVAPEPLVQSWLRRIQREISARNLPLGLVGLDNGEYGPQRLPAWDSLIEEHERAWRRQVLA